MTDPTPPPERDQPVTPTEDELVSAVLDGEATAEERAAVDTDPRLRARLAVFADIQADTAHVDEPDATATDAAIARALAVADPADVEPASPAEATSLAQARERRRRRVAAVLAAAAVIVVVVPLLAVTLFGGGHEQNVASSGSDDRDAAVEEQEAADSGSPGAALEMAPGTLPSTMAGAPVIDAGDLGAVRSIAGLRSAVLTALATTAAAERATRDEGASSTTTAPPSAAASTTNPCAAAIAGSDPSLGSIVLTATATVEGAPVNVFVFSAGNGMLVVAGLDCSVLEQSPL